MSRYSRQEILRQIGKKGQIRLKKAHVCIVGVGALGSRTAELLCRAGIKKLTLIDPDRIELSNLQRQTLFEEKDVSKNKAKTAKNKLNKINSKIDIVTQEKRLEKNSLHLLKSDIILDGTDNLETRFLINRYAIENNIPYIFASVVKAKGMVFTIDGPPCLRCILKDLISEENCSQDGILNTIVSAISSIQVTEALKILTGQPHSENLLIFDIWTQELTRIKVKKSRTCPVCSMEKKNKEKDQDIIISKCKTKAAYSAKHPSKKRLDLKKIGKKFKIVMETPILLVIDKDGQIIVHKHGELLFKELKDTKKMKKIAQDIFKEG